MTSAVLLMQDTALILTNQLINQFTVLLVILLVALGRYHVCCACISLNSDDGHCGELIVGYMLVCFLRVVFVEHIITKGGVSVSVELKWYYWKIALRHFIGLIAEVRTIIFWFAYFFKF